MISKKKALMYLVSISMIVNLCLGLLVAHISRRAISGDALPSAGIATKTSVQSLESSAVVSPPKPYAYLPADYDKQTPLQNDIVKNQPFYGVWKIVKTIPTEYGTSSSYGHSDEDGVWYWLNPSAIVGKTIEYRDDHVSFDGESYNYVFGPSTFANALLPGDNKIAAYSASSLGQSGPYYMTVKYQITDHYVPGVPKRTYVPDNPEVPGSSKHIDVALSDLTTLYLKDADTLYASDNLYAFLLKRIDK